MKRSESSDEQLRDRVKTFGYGGTARWARMREYDLRVRLGAEIPEYMRPDETPELPAEAAPAPVTIETPTVRALPERTRRPTAVPVELGTDRAPHPVKAPPPVTIFEREAVLVLIHQAERPLSRSLMLCKLRGFDRDRVWHIERLERTLADLVACGKVRVRENLYSLG